ncbi:hypothetical protein [Paraburkholderia dipogonis]|uniref:hypothetical protein n=1 Tax=Paraburkholderia dipogonis TaxID=1211383 RepID=UPI0038BCA9EF
MPWTLSDAKTQQELEQTFEGDGVAFDTVGFYDEPNFLARERQDPRYLELYARYVESKAYNDDYLIAATRKIGVAAEALRDAIERDGRQGACVDASGMLGRMLDKLGIWNYVAMATLTIEFPHGSGLSPRYFWTFDQGEFAAPHAVVVAPPYYVVDVTVKHQPYDARRARLIPPLILADTFKSGKWRPEDLANHDLLGELRQRGISFNDFLIRQNPGMASLLGKLPVRTVWFKGTSLKYAIVAVGGSIEPLEENTGYKPGVRTAQQIFDEDVLPQIT